jgi:hypothetical protein
MDVVYLNTHHDLAEESILSFKTIEEYTVQLNPEEQR